MKPGRVLHKHLDLAVIGGGFSGLGSAYYFKKFVSRPANVAVFEQNNRSGGWCNAYVVPHNGRNILFELGPRSLRPRNLEGWLTIAAAHDIGLSRDLIIVPKTAPSALYRYLYDGNRISALPHNLFKALGNLKMLRVFANALLEPFRARRSSAKDTSVDAFMRSHFGPLVADHFMSAMVRGIYAADSRDLSLRASFPSLLFKERQFRSVLLGSFRQTQLPSAPPGSLVEPSIDSLQSHIPPETASELSNASVWGVKGGLSRIISAFRDWLDARGIRVHHQSRVVSVSWDDHNKVWLLNLDDGSHVTSSRLITSNLSCLPPSLASGIVSEIPKASVRMVHLAFDVSNSPRPFPPGFGYLVPRSVPVQKNPASVLGCIFDSDVMPNVDSSGPDIVKATIMMSPKVDEFVLAQPENSKYAFPHNLPPQESALITAALGSLESHLNLETLPPIIHAAAFKLDNCIPTPPVGHADLMQTLQHRIHTGPWNGSLAVVGDSTSYIGVNGSMRGAWEAGKSMACAHDGNPVTSSGLDVWHELNNN